MIIRIMSMVSMGFFLAGAACASAPSDIVADYAACMADQSRPLYALAAPGFGGAFTTEAAIVSLRAELASGETTIAEIEGAYAIFCDGD